MVNIGLTGGIGSGKTLISKVFKLVRVPIYYSDMEAKLLYYQPEVKSQVIDLLGHNAYIGNTINKQYISNLIFNDKDLLQKINAIFHPQVRLHYAKWVKNQTSNIVIQETALLFESKLQDKFDKTILVTAPEEVRLQRAMQRDNATESQIKDRMENQLPDEQKITLADYVIINDGMSKVLPQVISLYRELQSVNRSME